MPELWLALILIGLVAGVAGGMFGIGGGIIIVPALAVLLAYPIKAATGTSLAALLLPVALFAVLSYYRAGKIRLPVAAWVALGLVGGSVVGAQIALGLDDRLLKFLYGSFLLYMFWRFSEPRKWLQERRGQRPPEPPKTERDSAPWYWLLLIGLTAGTLGGMFGIGGGVIIVAALVEGLRMDQKLAIGTSLAAQLPPVNLGGVLSYYADGWLNIAAAAMVAIGLVAGNIVGAKVTLGLPAGQVRRIYGLFLLVVGLRYIVFG